MISCSSEVETRRIVIEEPVSIDASVDIGSDTNLFCGLFTYCDIFQYEELACKDNNGRQLFDLCGRKCILCANSALGCVQESDNSYCSYKCRNCK